MGRPLPTVSILRLLSTWDAQVSPSARRALLALTVAVFFLMAHLARTGTPVARGCAAAAFVLTLGAVLARALVLRRRRADPRRIVEHTVARLDRPLGEATLRALTLVERTRADERAGSPELAALHLDRLLGRVSHRRLDDRAARVALRWSAMGVGFALVSALAVLVEPLRVVEGLDVLAASGREAPVPLAWLSGVAMGVTPPEYLHRGSSDVRPFRLTQQPRGTTLTVRGHALRAGRDIVLSDGTSDVPFVEDGAGGLLARWSVQQTATLHVAARFGEVLIRQPDEQVVVAIPDAVPRVVVEGAPRTVRLLDEPSIPIHYEAYDDHGLREVNLVLRAGDREERRVLSRPAADVLVDRGGYEVQAKDKFFKRTYVPVEVTVEARDNDTVSGPQWGKSASIIILPPEVGEPEARRYRALLEARDAVTDLTAYRVTEGPPTPATVKEHAAREAREQLEAVRAVSQALAGTYGGLRVRGAFASLARGQLRRLNKALAAEAAVPNAATHQGLLDETEAVLLALDAGVRMVGDKDTRTVAKRLADVADEAAIGLAAARSGTDDEAALARVDAAVAVLDGGGRQMLKLGDLGLDLGEIVANDLRRVARARGAGDLMHAELAAQDLAARLRKPDPSFSGGGGKGMSRRGQGGVESAGAPSAADAGETSPAGEEADETERELMELAREHGAAIQDVEESLERAVSAEELDKLKEEAKRHADAIREAVKKLPNARGDRGSAESSAAAGREEAEAMAGALDAARPRDAVESGRRAVDRLRQAQRLGEQSGYEPEEEAGRDAAAARPTLERELAWAEEALEELRRAASERAKAELGQHGQKEQKLAKRAQELGQEGESGERSMPQEMLDRLGEAEQAMREAERALREGDGERGLRRQRDAQRLLEMARGEGDDNAEREGPSDQEGGKAPSGKADIPGKDLHKGPEEFRRRVQQGLGGSSDPLLREAVRRYAEGLLK